MFMWSPCLGQICDVEWVAEKAHVKHEDWALAMEAAVNRLDRHAYCLGVPLVQ